MSICGSLAARIALRLSTADARMRLDLYTSAGFDRGATRLTEVVWIFLQGFLIASWLPGSRWRCALFRMFGAKIGANVTIKPGLRVKFPWRLTVGEHVWLGEDVWIDNLVAVSIDSHTCISQGAYLCTGSHNWAEPRFSLIVREIKIGKGCWVAAKAKVSPGTIMEDGAILAMGALGSGRLRKNKIYGLDGSVKDRPVL